MRDVELAGKTDHGQSARDDDHFSQRSAIRQGSFFDTNKKENEHSEPRKHDREKSGLNICTVAFNAPAQNLHKNPEFLQR